MSDASDAVEAMFRAGAVRASQALAAWLERPASIAVEQLDTLPLEQAMAVLGPENEPMCSAVMQVSGTIGGVLVLAAADEAGLVIADVLIGRPSGTSLAWGDLERSTLCETANIVGCAYLAALATGLAGTAREAAIPSPPWFVRDFPPALMDAVLAVQAGVGDSVVVAKTDLRIAGDRLRCALVFVPDDAARIRLAQPHAKGSTT